MTETYRYVEASVNKFVENVNSRRADSADFAVRLNMTQAEIDEKLQRYMWDVRGRVAEGKPLDDYTVAADEEAEHMALLASSPSVLKKKLSAYGKSLPFRLVEELVNENDERLAGVIVGKDKQTKAKASCRKRREEEEDD